MKFATAKVFGYDGTHTVRISLIKDSSIPEVPTIVTFKGQTYVQISTAPLTYRWVQAGRAIAL